MSNVVIVDYLRSPFSRSRPNKPERDVFNKVRMDETLARVINKMLDRSKVDPSEINDLLTGCALQMRENYLMGGRTIAMLAGFPFEVPAQGMDRVCISGMSAIHQGCMEIMLDYSDTVVASGMEHMTHVALDPRFNPDLMNVSPRFFQDPDMKKYDLATALSMGLTAEKLWSETNFTREQMDEWSMGSHKKAAEALESGFLAGEILPVEAELDSGETMLVDNDQAIRPDTTMEQLGQLPPAFKPEGQITAGNSSPLNAGVASVLLMNEEKAKSRGLKPMARVISMGWAGVDPSVMGKGPVPASRMALEKADMTTDDIDYWEINEAFSVVAMYGVEQLGLDPEKVNIHGGAVAIGHPLAASGPRLTGTMSRILQEKDAKYGIATLCGGGGQGGAVILEKV